MNVSAALLPDRSVVEVSGEERLSFLQGLITNDAEGLLEGTARFAGLLSPQGKILFEFLVINGGSTVFLDCAAATEQALRTRLAFYKLRRRVVLSGASDRWQIAAAWGEGAAGSLKTCAAFSYPDPRLPGLGMRALIDAGSSPHARLFEGDYEAMRIGAGVPEGGKDYAFGEVFPHEACFDLLYGVDFKKGCYVGQEVVSRMQHRGTARTRVLKARASEPLPEGGVPITADGFTVGRLGSVAGGLGIALARLDRVKEAAGKGQQLLADSVPVTLSVPDWAPYSLGNEGAGE
jgi:tRNA-modifying protein YgfZ